LLYSTKLPFIIEGEIKCFDNEQKLKILTVTKTIPHKVHPRIPYTEEKDKCNHEYGGKNKSH
jgi:hypothetical protein